MSDEMEVTVTATVSAFDVVMAADWDSAKVLEFILALDREMSDLVFTIELRDKLAKAIEEELK